jgi:hypothetical protein
MILTPIYEAEFLGFSYRSGFITPSVADDEAAP